MKTRLAIPPTKTSLLQVSRQTRFLEQGQAMLEKKRDLLTRLVYDRLRQYRALRAQARAELGETYRWLGLVHMRMGGQMLAQAAIGLQPAVSIRILARSSVGVEYPSASVAPLPLMPVGLMWTDPSFDEARLHLQRLSLTLARLGEAEAALWRLLAASRKTRMRVNALQHNIIPRYRSMLRYIRSVLEEDERNTLFQVRLLQSRPH